MPTQKDLNFDLEDYDELYSELAIKFERLIESLSNMEMSGIAELLEDFMFEFDQFEILYHSFEDTVFLYVNNIQSITGQFNKATKMKHFVMFVIDDLTGSKNTLIRLRLFEQEDCLGDFGFNDIIYKAESRPDGQLLSFCTCLVPWEPGLYAEW